MRFSVEGDGDARYWDERDGVLIVFRDDSFITPAELEFFCLKGDFVHVRADGLEVAVDVGGVVPVEVGLSNGTSDRMAKPTWRSNGFSIRARFQLKMSPAELRTLLSSDRLTTRIAFENEPGRVFDDRRYQPPPAALVDRFLARCGEREAPPIEVGR
ncbi:hypothetical protein [Caulobacter flavus]|uniref:hypothetical protein n=1 Tax=Caulobacter flavus TaxID=1679497 RepID=UPI0013DDC498|nr:hypothetical protein [Caulobacter flavus]